MPNTEKDYSYVDAWKSMWEPDLEAIAYNGATCDPTKVEPQVLEWVRQNCAHKPHFVKVIITAASYGWHGSGGKRTCQMIVPRPFLRDHYKELGRVVTLENGISQQKWKVSFGAPRKNSSWLQGWRKVADDNSLRPGDVMIFVLVGHSHFRFYLFDENGNHIPGTNRPKQLKNAKEINIARVKAEPNVNTSHNHQEQVFTDSEDEFKHKKLRRLFDPDLAIVKMEPGLFQSELSGDIRPPSWANDHPNEQIVEPLLCKKPTMPEIRSSPHSDLTVTDRVEPIAGGEVVCDGNSVPNYTKQCLIDPPQIAVIVNIENLAEKCISTARCETSSQIDEGSQDGAVKRKLEFDTPNNLKSVKEEFCLTKSGTQISQQTSTFSDLAQEAPQLQENIANSPTKRVWPIDPLAYFVKSRRRMPTATERKRALEAAEGHAADLKGLHFKVVMSDTQVYTDFHLALPDLFVTESGFPTSLTQLSLVDGNGSKTWEVFSKVNRYNEVSFNRKYWGVFSLENFLEEGDVCVFELKNKDSFIMSVRIFRVLQLPKYLGRTSTVNEHYELRLKPKS